MCTLGQRVFLCICAVFVVFDLCVCVSGAPSKPGGNKIQPLVDAFKAYNDYDLHYDQRQQGKSNLKLKLDGFAFLLPFDALDFLALAALVPLELLENFEEERRISAKVPGSVRLRQLVDRSKL